MRCDDAVKLSMAAVVRPNDGPLLDFQRRAREILVPLDANGNGSLNRPIARDDSKFRQADERFVLEDERSGMADRRRSGRRVLEVSISYRDIEQQRLTAGCCVPPSSMADGPAVWEPAARSGSRSVHSEQLPVGRLRSPVRPAHSAGYQDRAFGKLKAITLLNNEMQPNALNK